MVRHTTPEAFTDLVEMARSAIPDVAITTDIIVGFPGESDQEFEESLALVSQIGFSGGHVFRYSARDGTAAARIPGRINGSIARQRAAKMHSLLQESEKSFLTKAIGKELTVLWEGTGKQENGGWTLHGLSDQYMKVEARAEKNRWNQIDTVSIAGVKDETLAGKIIL